MPSARKIAIVDKLREKVSRAKALVFADYQGLTHKQIEGLKNALRSVDSEFVVTKNTLLRRAIQEGKNDAVKRTGEKLTFEKPTATLFAYGDFIAPLKELAKTIRLLKLPSIKFAIVEGKLFSAEDVLRLATLPSREILLAQLVGGIKAPIYGLHRALSWNLQKFVMTLKAIEQKK